MFGPHNGWTSSLARLERINNWIGDWYDPGEGDTWNAGTGECMEVFLAIKCYNNQYNFGGRVGEAGSCNWSGYKPATTLGITPTQIGFFLKEWNN